MLISIRGATTVEENNKELILKATEELLLKIIESNDLNKKDITSVLFSATNDLDKVYPAVAARRIGLTEAALMCFQELYVEDSMPMCIRVMVNAITERPQSNSLHIYQNRAKALRPDITNANDKTEKYFSIAIDGPSGAGKSTVAKLCAKRLNFIYIDTGAMYRTFAYYCIKHYIDISNENQVNEALSKANIEVKFADGAQRLFTQCEDVTDKIRTQQVADVTSKLSVMVSVRKTLVEMQIKLAKSVNVIMDGRDIGSVVLKDSPLKIYLDADKKLRAKRRLCEVNAGEPTDFESVLAEIEDRDFRDMNRATDPLIKCDDAVIIDSGNLSATEVAEMICALARTRFSI